MHIRDSRVTSHLTRAKECIEKAERYYSEIEMTSEVLDISASQHMPAGTDIRSYLSDHQYDRLRKSFLKSFRLDIEQFKTLYPLILSNLILTSILSNDLDEIMDFHLFRHAKNQGKQMHYLESQYDQIGLFHRIPIDYQIRSLRQLGRQPAKAKRQLWSLLEDYSRGRTRQLYQKSKRQLGKMRHLLLYQRNIHMAQTIAEDLSEKSGFVGVGAAHLYGYQGILRILKYSGFKIQPLS